MKPMFSAGASMSRFLGLLAVAWLISPNGCAAEPFDCGSTGAYGPIDIPQGTGPTLDLPPDGIFHCTTITVGQGATLRFNRNPLNTPVYLLATGDVVINGAIDVSGNGQSGGPGGFDGGSGGSVFEGCHGGGDGQGPGAGKNVEGMWHAVFGSGASGYGRNTNTYGNSLLWPLIGGSGGSGSDGSPGTGGGGGGGAVLLSSNTRITIAGNVSATGGGGRDYGIGMGSGGAVRCVAPTVTGTGSLSVMGFMDFQTASGQGRIRIDCTDHQAYRSLAVSGVASRGSRMIVFPAVIPALDIVEVAGNAIPAGTNAPVFFELPVGAPSNQTVRIQACNFTNDVPIRVVVTPEHGSRGEYDAMILQASGNPPFASVPVVIPAGSVCQIHAWTR